MLNALQINKKKNYTLSTFPLSNRRNFEDSGILLSFLYLNFTRVLLTAQAHKATITRCDLSPRFFYIDATLLCQFESDKT